MSADSLLSVFFWKGIATQGREGGGDLSVGILTILSACFPNNSILAPIALVWGKEVM